MAHAGIFNKGGRGGLSRILTSMLSLNYDAVIHIFASKERKLYHNYSTSPISLYHKNSSQTISIRGLAVPRAGDRSFVTSSIHGGNRSHLTYTVAHPGFGKGEAHRGSGG